MKERPILFNGPMVRAILEGRKTQTRRLFNAPPWDYEIDDGQCWVEDIYGDWHFWCPFGQPGDRLWVRETFSPAYTFSEEGSFRWAHYRATLEKGIGYTPRWRPSIHMPRWASRITLEITGVRLERLQSISETDAVAESCRPGRMDELSSSSIYRNARENFFTLWDDIYGQGAWTVNPWVWAIEFKRIEQPRGGADNNKQPREGDRGDGKETPDQTGLSGR